MMTKLEVLDTSTMQELMSIIEKFQFSLAMFKKYREIFSRVGFHALRYFGFYNQRRRNRFLKVVTFKRLRLGAICVCEEVAPRT